MKQRIQLILAVALVVAGVRLAWILYERHQDAVGTQNKPTAPLHADYYVHPKKLRPYDLKSARQLTQQPVWVKVGYAYPYFPYSVASHHADLAHEAGKLPPLEKLEIKDIVSGASPEAPHLRQVLATFDRNGKLYAVPIGRESGGSYSFDSDDMFFVEDPHQLYKHWPADIWRAIDGHQVKPGMSEIQADFAIGIGLLEPGGDATDRTLNYPNGGTPITISYHNGKAVEIRPGSPSGSNLESLNHRGWKG
jgi:hypothetical protein